MAPDHSSLFGEKAFADELVRAHLTGRGAAAAALSVPPSPASAMQVQALVQKQLGKTVGGWKVAIGPQQLPVAAPLLDLYSDKTQIALFQNCKIEIELAVQLGKDIPKRETGSYQRSDMLDSIEHVLMGIEVIGGRFDPPTNVPFFSFLADNLGNRGYVVGGKVPLAALREINGLDCHVTLGGQTLHHAAAAHPNGDPLAPLLAYANAQSDCLGGLKAGQIVTTGSLCGVLPVSAAGLIEANVAQVGRVSVRFSV